MTEKGENIQPKLIDLPEIPIEIDDFLTPEGKKKNSIPTGMTREQINELAKNKGIQEPAAIGDDDWAKK